MSILTAWTYIQLQNTKVASVTEAGLTIAYTILERGYPVVMLASSHVVGTFKDMYARFRASKGGRPGLPDFRVDSDAEMLPVRPLRSSSRIVFVFGGGSGDSTGTRFSFGREAMKCLPSPDRIATVGVTREERRWLFDARSPFMRGERIELPDEHLHAVKVTNRVMDDGVPEGIAGFLLRSVEPDQAIVG